jgi:hypothetical protein
MNCRRFLLPLLASLLMTAAAQAGILFGKQKPNPAQRVPQLITILKTDPSESAREKAAAELREYDATAFPEIVLVLVDVLQHDARPGVRAEAAQSLGKLRPVSQEAGQALEEATKDSSLRVRWQARSSLLSYRLGGYRSQKPPEGAAGKIPGYPPSGRVSASGSSSSYIVGETPPPPLAPEPPAPAPARAARPPVIQPTRAEPRPATPPAQKEPRPLPMGPPRPQKQPVIAPAKPKPQPPPATAPDEGPDLPPDMN